MGKDESTIKLLNELSLSGEVFIFDEIVRVNALSRHFNALFEGYKALDDPYKWSTETKSILTPLEHCSILFEQMGLMSVAPDAFTLTLLMSLQKNSNDITHLWNEVMSRKKINAAYPVYHSIITAYGKVGDSASACHVFDKMIASSSLHPRLKSWNVLLSALSKASKEFPEMVIDCEASNAFNLDLDTTVVNERPFNGKDFSTLIDGLSVTQATRTILDLMIKSKVDGGLSNLVLNPNSQSYCLVASSIANSGERLDADEILQLYISSEDNSIPIDGRFINAIIRCYDNDISEAIQAWKTVYRPAILASAPTSSEESPTQIATFELRKSRFGKNLIAAYHGLLYVSGKSYRPDIALRIAYAMTKEGVEPTEASINAYNAGSRLTKTGKEKIRFHGQYENLLLVECTKYDSNDRRRVADKRVRIII